MLPLTKPLTFMSVAGTSGDETLYPIGSVNFYYLLIERGSMYSMSERVFQWVPTKTVPSFFHGGSLGIKRITHVQVISSVHSAATLTGAVVNCPYGDLSRVTKPVKSARRFFTP